MKKKSRLCETTSWKNFPDCNRFFQVELIQEHDLIENVLEKVERSKERSNKARGKYSVHILEL